MTSSKSTLRKLLKDLGMEGALNLGRIAGNWDALFNGPISLHTSPEALSSGILTVSVDSPAWLHQASFLRHQMISSLRVFGVTSIRFRQGPVRPKEQVHASSPEEHEITPEEKAEVDAMLAGIKDCDLRESIRGAALRSFSRGGKGQGIMRRDIRRNNKPLTEKGFLG